jgi:hypothetical protein
MSTTHLLTSIYNFGGKICLNHRQGDDCVWRMGKRHVGCFTGSSDVSKVEWRWSFPFSVTEVIGVSYGCCCLFAAVATFK